MFSEESTPSPKGLILNSAGGGNAPISCSMAARAKKKSTSIYPPICSRMEDKLFQFYKNECFMSCPCFPDSALNSYMLPNAWAFPRAVLPGPSASLGFSLRILGPRGLSLAPALESLAIYHFSFKMNRKKIHSSFCFQGKWPLPFWHTSSRFLFLCIKSFASFPPSPQSCIYFCSLLYFSNEHALLSLSQNLGEKTRKFLKVSLWYVVFLETFSVGKLLFRSNLKPATVTWL